MSGATRTNAVAGAAQLIFDPILWTGLEYFRSELYQLKFSWLSPGFVLGPNVGIPALGSYGLTFALMAVLTAISMMRRERRALATAALAVRMFELLKVPARTESSGATLRLAGMQMEFPVELEVPAKLDALKAKHPDADIYVLSEYTFDGPILKGVRAWCKRNSKYLIAGGKDPAPNNNFYNTAFVVDPNGEIVFKQVKAVPIQFFKDGLPAPEQKLWNSPWGKIALCVCYDLSYTRVIDNLVRQGAEIIINPTMDVADWGAGQHELHSLIPPMRAAEYRIPIFRVASSGMSQAIDERGKILASAGFPGEEAMIAATLKLGRRTSLPLDRVLAPVATALTVLFLAYLAVGERALNVWTRYRLKAALQT
ncbi:MAG TPA: nitrilase-related carbon-nitrogen hydrolase [Verrucomicrobiae bacterium]|nr:nitrilase-related carbon-nitrogen hydrolase [Verrucomicrobiae bacterium]